MPQISLGNVFKVNRSFELLLMKNEQRFLHQILFVSTPLSLCVNVCVFVCVGSASSSCAGVPVSQSEPRPLHRNYME